MMDKYFDSYGKTIRGSEICNVVKSIFRIDLDAITVLSKEAEEHLKAIPSTDGTAKQSKAKLVMDSYLDQYEKEITGSDIRRMINQFLGINLDAISSLVGARISLYSKDQWVVQQENDLFAVKTGTGDVDVEIFPTTYFTEQTGLKELPNALQLSLSTIGFCNNEEIGSYYYVSPTGEAVPDAFKGRTIGAILEVIHKSYAHL
jgi:hypothetical protein